MSKRNAVAREVAGFEDCKKPGDFYFVEYGGERAGLIHACPCGCERVGALYWKNPTPGGANWTVTGEWPNASLDPSIGFKGGHDSPKGSDGFHWHGYLRNGVFGEC